MHTLLNPLSLPQRLLNRALNPLAIGLLLAALLAVWTICGIVDTRTTVALSITASNASTSFSLDSSTVHALASSYVQRQRDKTQNQVADYLAAQVYPGWRRAISSWNESLGTSVHAQRIMYDYILSCNETITDTLYGKSLQINESLDALSMGNAEIGNQNLSTLSVDYWFVSVLFGNVSKNNTKLAKLKVDFPTISNQTQLNLPNTSVKALVEKIEAIVDQNSTATISATASVKEQKIVPPVDTQGRLLTAIFVSTYAVCIILSCFYEWILYRWETMIFNRHMDWYFNPSNKLEDCGVITAQQRLRKFAKQLVFTLHSVPVYWLASWAGARENKYSSHWQRLVHFQWWVWYNAGYLWLLLLATMVHWQIYISLMRCWSGDIARQEATWPINSNQTHTYNRTSFYPRVFEVCDEFEGHVFQTLNDSVALQLWSPNGTLTRALDTINNQMNRLVSTVDVAAPPQWQNLSLSEEVYPSLQNISTNGKLGFNIVRKALFHETTIKTSEETSFISNFPGQTTQLHKWAVVAVVVVMATHHLLGLTVFTRLN